MSGFLEKGNDIELNPEEAAECRWLSLVNLEKELAENAEHFAPWVLPALEILKHNLQERGGRYGNFS